MKTASIPTAKKVKMKCPRQTVDGTELAEELNALLKCRGQADIYACEGGTHPIPSLYSDILFQGPNQTFSPIDQDALLAYAEQLYVTHKAGFMQNLNTQLAGTPFSVVGSTNHRYSFTRINSGTQQNPQLLILVHIEYYLCIGATLVKTPA